MILVLVGLLVLVSVLVERRIENLCLGRDYGHDHDHVLYLYLVLGRDLGFGLDRHQCRYIP